MSAARLIRAIRAFHWMGGLCLLAIAAGGCSGWGDEVSFSDVHSPGTDRIAEDNSTKQAPRLMPAEVYLRTWFKLLGGVSPAEAAKALGGAPGDELFDAWGDYLGAIGTPDHRRELRRPTGTHGLMIAAHERLGIAVCDRAIEHDFQGKSPAIKDRWIYRFTPLPDGAPPDLAAFAERFDRLHRLFLSYPAALAPTPRTARFFQLYLDTLARHLDPDAGASRFSPQEAAWAVVCQGLARHPEFLTY